MMSGSVFNHARNRAEFVVDAFDLDSRDSRAFNRAQQHASQAVADCGSESTLKRLRGELAEPVPSGLSVLATSLWGFWKPLNIV